MQPIHIREDIATARRLLGKRQRELYRFKSLLDSDAHVIFGSDAPIETPNVLEGFYYAMERRDKEGNWWYENERLSFEETLRAYTELPHRLINTGTRGRLEIGYEANAVIVPKDFLTELRQRKTAPSVLATISSGEIVFEKELTCVQ
jgi:predicted amidohydrolase YtcJ